MDILLILLIIKHFVIDAPLQTPFQYLNKGTYGHMGGVLHASLHGVGTFVCFMVFEPQLEMCVVISCLDAVIHYHIDWAKVNISTTRYSKMSNDPEGKPCLCIYDNKYFIWIVADQCLHFATYVLLINTPALLRW